jgi:hypothetical protein
MEFILEQFQKNKQVFYELFKDESEELFIWKQTPEKWCLLEILCHLYDEERKDFRFRTKWVLEKPNQIPPPFNPIDWVTDHDYMGQDYNIILDKFLKERESSINWLRSLENINWNHSFEHPKLGKMTAEYFLNNWLAHDYLHIRQIIKLKFDYLNNRFNEDLNYAGKW